MGTNVRSTVLGLGVAVANLGLLAACGHSGKHDKPTSSSDAGGVGDVGGASSNAGGAGGVIDAVPCEGEPVTTSKRIVRLSFNQLSNTVSSLIDRTFARQADLDLSIGTQAQSWRTFPPLSSPQEGGVIGKSIWPKNDQLGAEAGAYVLAHLDAVTACGDDPTEACASAFINAFAERAFRRPLTEAETISVAQLYTEVKGIWGTVPEAIQYSIYGLMQSPQLLYRTELGANQALAGPLTAYELASELSYFLTDGPPDQELLDAAKAGELSTRADITAQVERILLTSVAQQNLEGAMVSYFKLDNLLTVKIDDVAFTNGTTERPYLGVRESAYRESQLFFQNVLWSGPVAQLLTAKTSAINTTLAAFYGITLPTTPADESKFVQVELPATRGGLLTQVGFLASRSRPDSDDSVVTRGLVVNGALLCATNPALPDDPTNAEDVTNAQQLLANASPRERSEYRRTVEPCSSCHSLFDPYGLALQTYDGIGRYRTMDAQGRPIDPSVTLPPAAGGGVISDALDMEQQIARSPAFTSCLAKNLLNWAMAEGSETTPSSCTTQSVVAPFRAGDQTFSSLLREIAVSEAFRQRKAGLAQ